jgi:hypothetical protein
MQMKAVAEVTISIAIVLGVAVAIVRLMRTIMLDSMGGDAQAKRTRLSWVEKTTLMVVIGCALLGCVSVLLISGP